MSEMKTMTCRLHDDLTWETKAVAVNDKGQYTGTRNIFFVSNAPECACHPMYLIELQTYKAESATQQVNAEDDIAQILREIDPVTGASPPAPKFYRDEPVFITKLREEREAQRAEEERTRKGVFYEVVVREFAPNCLIDESPESDVTSRFFVERHDAMEWRDAYMREHLTGWTWDGENESFDSAPYEDGRFTSIGIATRNIF